jgi:hypothetical protein
MLVQQGRQGHCQPLMPLLHSARFSSADPVGVAVFLSPDGGVAAGRQT